MYANCADCTHKFLVTPDIVVAGSCPNCGGKRLERDQPSPTRSDGDLRNMVDPATGVDAGGNPLQEGIWGSIDGGWQPHNKRDESFAHVANADRLWEIAHQVLNSPGVTLVNPEGAQMAAAAVVQRAAEFGMPVSAQDAIQALKLGWLTSHPQQTPYEDDTAAWEPTNDLYTTDQEYLKEPLMQMPPALQQKLPRQPNYGTAMNNDTFDKTLYPSIWDNDPDWDTDNARRVEAGFLAPALPVLGTAARFILPKLMQGALMGTGSNMVGNLLNPGGGDQGGGAPVMQQPRPLDALSHTAAGDDENMPAETPTSNPGYFHDDPEAIDQHEFEDGSTSTNPENPMVNDEAGGSFTDVSNPGDEKAGVGADKPSFSADSPGVQRAEMLLPLLMHYHNSEQSGAQDPLIRELHEMLEKESPGYMDNVGPEHAHHFDWWLNQSKEPSAIQAAAIHKQAMGEYGMGPGANPGVGGNWGVDQVPGGRDTMPGQGMCPYCGGVQSADGSCPQCGAKAPSQGMQQTIPQQNSVPPGGYRDNMALPFVGKKSAIDFHSIYQGLMDQGIPSPEAYKLAEQQYYQAQAQESQAWHENNQPQPVQPELPVQWPGGSGVTPLNDVEPGHHVAPAMRGGYGEPVDEWGRPIAKVSGPFDYGLNKLDQLGKGVVQLMEGSAPRCPNCGRRMNNFDGQGNYMCLNDGFRMPQNAQNYGQGQGMGQSWGQPLAKVALGPGETQGPVTDEQKAVVSQFLIDSGRHDEIPVMLQQPWNYVDELAQVAGRVNVGPTLPEGQAPTQPPMPPGMDPAMMGAAPTGGDPSAMMPPMASVTAADNIARRCPNCKSGTTGVINRNGDCRCHSCGNVWREDNAVVERIGRTADYGDDSSPVENVPAPDAEDPANAEQDQSSLTFQDTSGQPLQPGGQYEMHSTRYSIPDLVRVDQVNGDEATVTTIGEAGGDPNNPESGLEYSHPVKAQDVQMYGITFEPVEDQDSNAGDQSLDQYSQQSQAPTFTEPISQKSHVKEAVTPYNALDPQGQALAQGYDQMTPGAQNAMGVANALRTNNGMLQNARERVQQNISMPNASPIMPVQPQTVPAAQPQVVPPPPQQAVPPPQQQVPDQPAPIIDPDGTVVGHVQPDEPQCLVCTSKHVSSYMISPTVFENECYKCGHVWKGAAEDTATDVDAAAREWLLGNSDDDFFTNFERIQGMEQSKTGSSRNIGDIAARDDRLQEIKNRLNNNKTAGKAFTQREQRDFIEERGSARNSDLLDLEGTHYEGEHPWDTKGNAGNVPDDYLMFGI